MRLIFPENLEDIALGAAVLGNGGGGDSYIGKLMSIAAISKHGPVQLVSPAEISDDCLVAISAMMASSAFHFSWEANRRRAVRSCKARDWAIA